MSEARKNLLSGTRDWSGEWRNSMDWHADGTHDGFTVMSRKFAWHGLSKPVKLVAGKTYTFSACVKVDPGQDHVVGIYLAISDTGNDTDLASSEIDDPYRRFYDVADGGWHIISHTFTPTASKCVRARVEANDDYFALSVCAYMLVEGSTPAAWAPAEGETVYNLLRSGDILWAGDITGTAQRITLSHVWTRKLISSEAFARIFKPGHTYTLSFSGKVIEPAPDTAFRSDRLGFALYSSAGGWSKSFVVWEYHDNPPAGYTFHKSRTFTTPDTYPGDVEMLAYSDYSRDENGVAHQGIVEIDDLMIVEGSTPAAWAPAEGETLTADGGGGTMTEPTNLVKTQPDATPATNNTRIWSRLDGTAQDSTTDYHIAATINPDAQIAAGATGLSIKYTDSSGADNWPRSASIASAIPANAWTRIEGTVTLPAGMTPYGVAIWWPSNATDMHFRACNLTVYPLTGGRIVRARGATAGYISKAKEATVLYTPSKSARQVRVILLDETGSSIYDIQSVAIVADAEELQGKVAAQESSIQTIQSDMTTVQSGLSGLNVRLASMQTELAGVSAGDVLYQVPYTVSDGKATFTAAVYKAGVECHTSYDPSCFTWYLKSEAGTVKIGTGYSVTVNVGDVGYGGFVVGVFETQ